MNATAHRVQPATPDILVHYTTIDPADRGQCRQTYANTGGMSRVLATPPPKEHPLTSVPQSDGHAVAPQDEVTEKAISRAIGEELRRAREANGWSRNYLITRLPSGIGARTLLSYEHGTRHLTLLRFIELCRALGVAAPALLNQALQRARIHLQNLVLQIDLHQLLNDRNDQFLPMVQWAHNKLIEYPAGIVDLPPSSVRELATFLGCQYHKLSTYLAKFIPNYPPDDKTNNQPRDADVSRE